MGKNPIINSDKSPYLFAVNSLPNCLQFVQRVSPDKVNLLKGRLKGYLYAWQCVLPCLVAQANGARIGEVLKLRWRDVFINGMAVAQGEKGSNSRLINTFMPWELCEFQRKNAPDALVFPFCYRKVYHFSRMAGLSESVKGRKNKAVTHSGRYKVATAAAESLGAETAQQVLGHKSKRSTEHYIKSSLLDKVLTKKVRKFKPGKCPKWEI